ncbi:MAG: lysylphosphatidylglycerol synthase transmembrane domain-containing protein [Myxococcota bacterium]|nr:lysylphosphatidylglycerol synthase transmembrane domain-containing protein [Myxococcota bacterium]
MLNKQNALKKGLFILFSTIFALVIGIVALWKMEIQENSLANLWATSDKGYILIALALISSSIPFVGMRWRALLPNKSKHSPLLLTGVLSAAFVFNIALPGPVGELISAGMVQKKYKTPFSEAISSLLVSRIIGLGSACMIAALMYYLFPLQIPGEWDRILGVSAIVLSVGTLGIISLGVFPEFFLRIIQWIPFKGWLKKIQDVFVHVIEALIKTAKRGLFAYLESFFWAICGHVMVASGIFVAAVSLGVTAGDISATLQTGQTVSEMFEQDYSQKNTDTLTGILLATDTRSAEGRWDFSTDNGSTWIPVHSMEPSTSKPLFLNAESKLRFDPGRDTVKVPNLTAHYVSKRYVDAPENSGTLVSALASTTNSTSSTHAGSVSMSDILDSHRPYMSWTAITFTYAASIAASVAMFMLPGSSAAWDAIFAGTLSVTGNISLMEAVSITLVVRIQQLLVVLFGLLVLWWMSKDLLDIEPTNLER